MVLRGKWVLVLFALFGILATFLTFYTPTLAPSLSTAGESSRIAIGRTAPDFSATTADGKTIALIDLRGDVVALNFWTTWCVPCRTEMPELQNAGLRHANLRVLAVNVQESLDQVKKFQLDLRLKLDIVLDQDRVITSLYGIGALPETVWIDPRGIVRYQHLGPLTSELIDQYVDELAKQP